MPFFQLNPLYFIPLVELMPAPWTDPSAVAHVKSLLEEVGQSPVVLTKEVGGFCSRVEHAMVMEALRLVEVAISFYTFFQMQSFPIMSYLGEVGADRCHVPLCITFGGRGGALP